MRRNMTRRFAPIAAAIVMGTMGSAFAEDHTARIERELNDLRAEVARLKGQTDDNWLTERRAEEIKAIVHEVLADARSRPSFHEGGVTAGWDKHFFLASNDGNFLLQIEGQIQPRYIWTNGEDISSSSGSDEGDENEGGFQQRRTKLGFKGHVLDPRLKYKIKSAFERDGGTFVLEEGYIEYDWAENHYVRLGQFKGRFIHEELVSSSKQQAVERSSVNEFFTLDYSQGVEVGGEYDRWNWSVIVHDGREADNVDFASDGTDLAVAGRVELLVAGSWKQFGDFAAWSGEDFAVMLGAGFDYENGEGGEGSAFDWEHMFQYTADISAELSPVNLYAAYIGREIAFDAGQGAPLAMSEDGAHQWGVVVQGGVFVIPDKLDFFARWEYLDYDWIGELTGTGTVSPLTFDPAAVDDHQHIVTVGGNYYFKKHDLKFTMDVMWAPDGIRRGESGAGTLTSNAGEDDLVAIRGQFQLLF